MLNGVYEDVKSRMDKTIEATSKEFGRVRTGRATPSLLEGISIKAYGDQLPVNQVATISIPQPRVIRIQPFDKANLGALEKAIQTSDLGVNPRNDGVTIIVELPSLSEERRQELAKIIQKKGEEMKIALRNIRRDGNDEIKMLEEEKEISEDDRDRGLKKIQDITDDFVKKIDELVSRKEKEIMEF
ncbi:MAG TPA: ribosome recycling factor [bacterium]|nr:ribosome recycling factor [bacterium]